MMKRYGYCVRFDGIEVALGNDEREAIVFVDDGNITTYFQPTSARGR